MARITLRPEILGISGRVGNMIFKTRKDGKTFAYSAQRQQRVTPISDKELSIRSRFKLMAQEVARRVAAGDTRTRKEIWQEVKQSFS